MKKAKKWFGDLYYSMQTLFKYLFSLPFFTIKRNKVVFINFNGKGYGDSPKYIAEELMERCLSFELVWLVKDKETELPFQIKKIPYRSVRAIYELSTAGFIITNVKNDLRINKRKNQIVFQTWHGSVSPKYVEKEAEDLLPKKYIKESIKNSKQTDYFLSNSRLLSLQISEVFWYDGEILEVGFPRNDVLIKDYKENRKLIRSKLSIMDNDLVILYTPTFRDDGDTSAYLADFESVANIFSKATSRNSIIWVRFHPNVSNDSLSISYGNTIKNMSYYPDVQELLIAADVLITDYSTTMFDFAIQYKPVFLYANDIMHYKKTRGIKDFYFKLPFILTETIDDLYSSVLTFNYDEYCDKLKEFMKSYESKDKGNASSKVVDVIEEIFSNI